MQARLLLDPQSAFKHRPWHLQVLPICKFGIDVCNAAPKLPFVCSLALTFCQATQFGGVLAVAGDMNVYGKLSSPIFPDCCKLLVRNMRLRSV